MNRIQDGYMLYIPYTAALHTARLSHLSLNTNYLRSMYSVSLFSLFFFNDVLSSYCMRSDFTVNRLNYPRSRSTCRVSSTYRTSYEIANYKSQKRFFVYRLASFKFILSRILDPPRKLIFNVTILTLFRKSYG